MKKGWLRISAIAAACTAAYIAGCVHIESGPVLKYKLNISEAEKAVRSSLEGSPVNEDWTSVETAETPKTDDTKLYDENTLIVTTPDTSELLPSFEGEPYELENNNAPEFTDDDYKKAEQPYEYYSQLDSLGRCGMVEACIVKDSMPTKKRGDIGYIKPSGWKQAKYAGIAGDGSYDKEQINMLENRCHLLGYQLGGAGGDGCDDAELNLITGTRYMNVQGMEPFENKTANYIRDTGKSVLYRVTPVFNDDELFARGVKMEAASVEDRGQSLSFNVYVFNVQPGIHIDYGTGETYSLDGSPDLYAGKR